MPGEEFVGPGDDGVVDLVQLGEFAGGVEITEPVERFEVAVLVVGEVEAVEFLEGLPGEVEAGVLGEQLIEAGLVSLVEMVASLRTRNRALNTSGSNAGITP